MLALESRAGGTECIVVGSIVARGTDFRTRDVRIDQCHRLGFDDDMDNVRVRLLCYRAHEIRNERSRSNASENRQLLAVFARREWQRAVVGLTGAISVILDDDEGRVWSFGERGRENIERRDGSRFIVVKKVVEETIEGIVRSSSDPMRPEYVAQ